MENVNTFYFNNTVVTFLFHFDTCSKFNMFAVLKKAHSSEIEI